MTKIMAVTLQQTLFGCMFNYGSISVDVVGKWGVDFTNLKNPQAVRSYLETIISQTNYESMHQMVHN